MLASRLTSQHSAILLVWVFFLCLLQLRQVDDLDIPTQITLGNNILVSRSLVFHESITFTHAGTEMVSPGWLAQVVFALAYAALSWEGVQFVHVLLFSLSFLLAAVAGTVFCSQRSDISTSAVISAMTLGILGSLSNSSARPQSIALFCFALTLWSLVSVDDYKKLVLILVPVFIVWQNSHSSLLMGTVVIGCFALGVVLDAFQNPESRSVKLNSFLALLALGLISGLLQLATPLGINIFQFGAANLRLSRDVLGVSEWLPPWDSAMIDAMIMFWILLVLSVVGLVAIRFKVRAVSLLLFLTFTAFSLFSARFSLFLFVAAIPLWIEVINQLLSKRYLRFLDIIFCRKLGVRGVILAAAAAVIMPAYIRPSIISTDVPLECVRHLKHLLPSGRIYNYREWAGFLTFYGYPNWTVAIDGRLYVYSLEEWMRYNDAARGLVSVASLEEIFNPDAFFLRNDFHRELISILSNSSHWKQDYIGRNCTVFLPATES